MMKFRTIYLAIALSWTLVFPVNGVTLDEIRELKTAGLDDQTIIEAIDSPIVITTKEIISLKKEGFSGELIRAILKSKKIKSASPNFIQSTETIRSKGIDQKIEIFKGRKEKNTTVKTSVDGPRFLVDGKLIGKLKSGENNFDISSGKRKIRMEYLSLNIDSEFEFTDSNNYIQAYDLVESNAVAEEVNKLFLKRYSRATSGYASDLIEVGSLVSSSGDKTGFYGYIDHKFTACNRVIVFDKEYYLIKSSGRYRTLRYGQEKNYTKVSEDETILLYVFVNKDGEVLKINENKKVGNLLRDKVDFFEKLKKRLDKIKSWDKSYSGGNNVIIVYSEKAKKDTVSFEFKIGLKENYFNAYTVGEGSHKVSPDHYFYLWRRSRLNPKAFIKIPEDKKVIIAVHSNWLGNQTKIHVIDKDKNTSGITFKNHKSYLR